MSKYLLACYSVSFVCLEYYIIGQGGLETFNFLMTYTLIYLQDHVSFD